MATEGPLYRDGAQCQAAANYWNPASALFGPNGSGQYLACFISAARVLTLQTTGGGVIYGIMQNSPAQGQAVDVALFPSITKAVAGAAFSAGVPLMVDTNGRLVTWTTGGFYQVAYSIEAAGAANALATVLLISPFKVVT